MCSLFLIFVIPPENTVRETVGLKSPSRCFLPGWTKIKKRPSHLIGLKVAGFEGVIDFVDETAADK